MARSGAEAFRGTDRFEVTGYLGEGGMGIVYRAVDRERDVEVALKTLHNVSAAGIFRFKQEFRALADVAHPNLVALHELFCEKEQWFFTMELIDGVDLLTHVCGQALDGDRSEHPTHRATFAERSAVTGPTRRFGVDDTLAPGDAPRTGAAPLRGRPLIGRLRQALPQLVAGITALHESGHLHQDIKPSNVMVTLAGRVVLMDFGVVAELRQRPGEPGEAAGTPAYMAPERLRDTQSTPASDWYSVGVVLYYALAGRLPFAGTPEQVLSDKLHSQPAPIRLQRPEVPEDLDQLCMDLLRADPTQRPTGAEVLRRLGAAAEHEERRAVVPVAPAPPAADELALVGRQAHLDALRGALARARTGAGAAVLVHGTSGMGKSALVRAFLEEVRVDRGAVVLAGRCYERESVPYSAVDTVIDALCQHLLSLPAAELAAIVPEDAGLLATLFPVLRRVAGIGEEPEDDDVASRPHELRRRAFAALRALLVRIAERCPLVLFIDDLQWGDADSAPLLDLITRAPGAPAMLLLGCYRTDEEHRSELLRASFWRDGRRDMEWLPVGALEPSQARELARTLLGVDDGAAEAVALESAGNPFFIQELVRYRSTGEHGAAADIPSLDVVIRARLDRLGADARRAVEVLAVAGRPLLQRVARTAAGIAEADWPILVQLVGTNRLVRVSGRRGDDLIECYHDRIRET
ncbi:MAG TPA: AAA family ATPase, partial [Kofleriaceae bacterium]|nr:AAA family ATPase [Kofleriaceae bacterium]